jgi:DNA polymerase elongation subunit (family B)
LKRIDDKLNLSNIMLSMSQKMGCALSDTLTTLKPWACYIANVCYEQNLALPKKTENEKPNIIGGFVRDPIAGKHQWVLSEDYNSMYPMNMVGFNMSPDTFVPLSKAPAEIRSILMQYFNDQDEDRVLNLPQDVWDQITPLLQKYQLSMGINGALFDISKEGIIPNLVWNIYTQRKADKKIMLKYEKQKEIIADILEKKALLQN